MSISGRRSVSETLAALVALAALGLAGCGAEARFTPGLHSLMVDLGMRHASLWFAGDAGNWPLADYMAHELEELLGDIEETHPVYHDIQVAVLLGEMTTPAVDAVEAAVVARDHDAFVRAFDDLTTACNHCHQAADRGAIVIQRPTAPPLSNIRYRPEAGPE